VHAHCGIVHTGIKVPFLLLYEAYIYIIIYTYTYNIYLYIYI
jgi:hypothetical protein